MGYYYLMLQGMFAFLILTLTLTASVFILALLLAKQYHSRLYLYAGLIFLGALSSLIVDVEAFSRYRINACPYSAYGWCSCLLTITGAFLMFYFMPLLVVRAAGIPVTRIKRSVHISILAIILFTIILEYLHFLEMAKIIRNILYSSFFIFSALLLFLNRKKVNRKDLRTVLLSFSILMFVSIPFIIIHRLVGFLFFPESVLFNLPYFNTLFLFISSIIALSYGAKYIFNGNGDSGIVLVEEVVKNYDISQREEEIIKLLIRGLSNKQIADDLYISEKTVKNHLYHIYRKLGISNRLQLINKCIDD